MARFGPNVADIWQHLSNRWSNLAEIGQTLATFRHLEQFFEHFTFGVIVRGAGGQLFRNIWVTYLSLPEPASTWPPASQLETFDDGGPGPCVLGPGASRSEVPMPELVHRASFPIIRCAPFPCYRYDGVQARRCQNCMCAWLLVAIGEGASVWKGHAGMDAGAHPPDHADRCGSLLGTAGFRVAGRSPPRPARFFPHSVGGTTAISVDVRVGPAGRREWGGGGEFGHCCAISAETHMLTISAIARCGPRPDPHIFELAASRGVRVHIQFWRSRPNVARLGQIWSELGKLCAEVGKF